MVQLKSNVKLASQKTPQIELTTSKVCSFLVKIWELNDSIHIFECVCANRTRAQKLFLCATFLWSCWAKFCSSSRMLVGSKLIFSFGSFPQECTLHTQFERSFRHFSLWLWYGHSWNDGISAESPAAFRFEGANNFEQNFAHALLNAYHDKLSQWNEWTSSIQLWTRLLFQMRKIPLHSVRY